MAAAQKSSSSEKSKPLLKRPQGRKYHTILSVDGGGIRGIIPTMVLIRLEECIKEHLWENRSTLIPEPERSSISSKDDFDIDLTDYFDLVAGTSIGSILATYVAARGKGSDDIMNNTKLRKKYGQLRKGSMQAVRVVFKEFGREVFPGRCSCLKSFLTFFRARYSNKGLKRVLHRTFGEMTMSDLDTGLLVTTYDLPRRAACSFLRGAVTDGESYTVRTAARKSARQSAADGAAVGDGADRSLPLPWVPDLDIKEGTNYNLKDITLASASAPTFLPPAKIAPLNSGDKITLVDGGVVANNPTLQALTYAPTAFSTSDVKDKIAILSLGCGATDPLQESESAPGALWWVTCGNITSHLSEGSAEYIQAVIDYWLYKVLDVKYGQYTRIQFTAAQNSKEEKVLQGMDDASKVPALEALGVQLAKNTDRSLKAFVRDFLFATN